MSSSREEESEIGAAETVEESEQAALDTAEVDLSMETSDEIAEAPDKSSSRWLTASGTVDRSGEETARRTSDSKETGLAGTTKKERKTGKGTTEPNKKEKKFPWILHKIIDEAEHEGNEHIVAWMPNGRSFIVHKRDTFTEQILPKYFRQTKYKSFVRQLNLWGFTYIDQGPEKGSYYCEHFIKGKKELCYKMKRLKTKPSQGGIGNMSSPGMMMMARSGMTPSPYHAGGRHITNALSMNPPPSTSGVDNSSNLSFSTIHSMQQSILFDSLRQQGRLDQFQTTFNESQHLYRNSQHSQQGKHSPRRYDEQLQLQSQSQQHHYSADRYAFSPMQLDTPMIQSDHQIAQNMNIEPSMFAPTLHPSSSSNVNALNRGNMNDPPRSQIDMMSFQNNAGRILSQNYLGSQLGSERTAFEYQQPMGGEQNDESMGFLPNLMDATGGMTGNTPYTQNTRPMETQGKSGCNSGNSSPDSKSSEMIERIDTFFAPAESSFVATSDFSKMLPVELEPRHFRSDDFVESAFGESHHTAPSTKLQWPSSSSTALKQGWEKSGHERKDSSPRNDPVNDQRTKWGQKG